MRRLIVAAVVGLARAAPPGAAEHPLAGGATFNTAGTVTPGTISDALVPGSQTVYRLTLDPGHRMTAQVRVDVAAIDPAAGNALQMSVALYSPLRDRVAEARATGAADTLTHVKTVSVEGPRTVEQGDWYLVVSATPLDAGAAAAPELPLSVTFASPMAAAGSAGKAGGHGVRWGLAAGLAAIALVAGALGAVAAARVAVRRRERH
ncbi:MAG: hypothetical protein ACJ76V_05100 [Thermoleophilaceae bacterium]